jgi:hypothetical protein
MIIDAKVLANLLNAHSVIFTELSDEIIMLGEQLKSSYEQRNYLDKELGTLMGRISMEPNPQVQVNLEQENLILKQAIEDLKKENEILNTHWENSMSECRDLGHRLLNSQIGKKETIPSDITAKKEPVYETSSTITKQQKLQPVFHHNPKPCKTCGIDFAPTHNRNMYCPKCNAAKKNINKPQESKAHPLAKSIEPEVEYELDKTLEEIHQRENHYNLTGKGSDDDLPF